MIPIYRNKHVEELTEFYGELLSDRDQANSVIDHLEMLAQKMYQGLFSTSDAPYIQFRNNHPTMMGKGIEELRSVDFSLSDCQNTIGREYGFANWADAKKQLGDTNYDFLFQQAIDVMLLGDLETLRLMLGKHPDLAMRTSQYGHRATLLLYTANNGVEIHRQQTPENILSIVKLLLEKGADIKAKMKVYGGEFDTIALLESSGHIFELDVARETLEFLKQNT